MATEPSTHRRALWLTVGLFLAVAAALGALYYAASIPPPLHSSPHNVRPWAESWYRNVYDSSTRSAAPDLSNSPPPKLEREFLPPSVEPPEEIRISFPRREQPNRNTLLELFPADTSFTAHVNEATAVTLEALAIMLPQKGQSADDKAIPEWIDARTGLPVETGDNSIWKQDWPVPSASPRLFLRFGVSGNSPYRLDWPQVHDNRTLQPLGAVSQYSRPDRNGILFIDLKTWHQTPLKIGLPIFFGEPDKRKLPLESGSSATFGNDAVVELAEILPEGFYSSMFRGSSLTLSLNPSIKRSPRKSMVFLIWPAATYRQIEFRLREKARFQTFLSFSGLATLSLAGKDTGIREIQLRRFPRQGLATFEVARLPNLPEVSNLFETPIPAVNLESGRQLLQTCADAAEVKIGSGLLTAPVNSKEFPLEMTNTNPTEILRKYENLTGKRLYLDQSSLEISDQKPPGLSEKLKAWWERHRPHWFR